MKIWSLTLVKLGSNWNYFCLSATNFTWNVNSSRDLAIYIDPDNKTAIISNSKLCFTSPTLDASPKPILLIVVCSAVGNLKARDTIRRTWLSLSPNDTAHFDVRTAFLLGQTVNDTRQSDVLMESNMYGDIIQGNSIKELIDFYLKWCNTLISNIN